LAIAKQTAQKKPRTLSAQEGRKYALTLSLKSFTVLPAAHNIDYVPLKQYLLTGYQSQEDF
jgi:hypothetical protein